MLTTPTPRPWMPLRRRRFELDYTFVPRTGRLARVGEDGHPRFVSPTAALARRRDRFRRPPSARDFRLRLDELAAEARAWVADLTSDGSDAPARKVRPIDQNDG